jgi:formylglycine-generating enzyme required for sulfatase activity
MAKIFISYRRKDSQDFTDRLFDHMSKHFGQENVFQDVGDSTKIPPGVDFVEYLAEQVQQCDVILVVIGEQWAQILKEREAQDDDFVRIEVESALQQKKIVIPVLKSNARMPSSGELPVSIQTLARRNASRVRPNPDFAKDCETLAQGIREVYAKSTGTIQPPVVQDSPKVQPQTVIQPPKPKLEQALELARNFRGTRNRDWTPIIMPLDEIVPETPMPEMEMCLVPVGKFMMGDDRGGKNQKPEHEQEIKRPYFIGRYPITNAQWSKAVQAGAVKEPKPDPNDEPLKWYGDSSMAQSPVVGINWVNGIKFTEWVKGQLPTELLWEFAARGVESWVYPWGNDWDGERCIYDKTPEYGRKKPAPVTLKPEGASWVGAMHLSGNVREWTSTLYQAYPYSASDGRESLEETRNSHVLRGGSWYDFDDLLRSAFRSRSDPDVSTLNNGFRCIRS